MSDPQTYEVVIVKYGTRQAMRSDVFLNYPVYNEADAPIAMDYFFWLIRGESQTIVVDTGFSRDGGSRRHRVMLTDPREALEALGVRPQDEPLVVITHAHYDHIGNLAHFRRSPVVIARQEMQFWAGRYGRRAQFHHSVDDAELDVLREAAAAGRVRFFDDQVSLGDGITVLRVGGHTPGQSIVTVRTAAGTVILASDAVHYYEECDRDMPFVSAANLIDMYAGLDLVRGMLGDGRADHLVTGHDPGTLDRFPPDTGPLGGGPLGGATATIGAAS